jgi:hypothetical protein
MCDTQVRFNAVAVCEVARGPVLSEALKRHLAFQIIYQTYFYVNPYTAVSAMSVREGSPNVFLHRVYERIKPALMTHTAETTLLNF